jgi:predicted DNA-binding transcriptional regulator AlpA
MTIQPLLRAAQVAEAFGVCPATIESWVRSGDFPAGRKLGGRRVWTEAQVNSWLDSQDAPATTAGGPQTAG